MNADSKQRLGYLNLLVILLLLYLTVFTLPSLDTILELKNSFIKTIEDFNQLKAQVGTALSGEAKVLPTQTIEMLFLLRTYQINEYQLSAKIINDPILY